MLAEASPPSTRSSSITNHALTDDQLVQFIKTEFERVGASTHITPREVIRDFIELLDIMYQNPDAQMDELLASLTHSPAPLRPMLE